MSHADFFLFNFNWVDNPYYLLGMLQNVEEITEKKTEKDFVPKEILVMELVSKGK